MNLHYIVNPGDTGGIGTTGVPDSSSSQGVRGQHPAVVDTARSARAHVHSQTTSTLAAPAERDPGRPRSHGPPRSTSRRGGTVTKKPRSSQSANPPVSASPASGLVPRKHTRRGRARCRAPPTPEGRAPAPSSRPEQSANSAPASRPQAIADLYSVARGQRVSIMDVVLAKQSEAAAARGPDEDLLDALEECQRIAMHGPSDEETVLEMISPLWYGVRQARKWQGTVVTPVDCSSSRIYQVSAERSTASWDDALDSDAASSSDSPCTSTQ